MMSIRLLFALVSFLLFTTCGAQSSADDAPGSIYYRTGKASWGGIGKFYLGREISHVMGHRGADWLEREEREEEENVSQAIQNMQLQGDEVVADIGAGSGYYAFRVAEALPEGKVLAVDLQPEMLAIMQQKIEEESINNVELIQAEEADPQLPANSVDMVFMVDVYHELAYPKEVMQKIVAALRPEGRFILLEYRMEDPDVPITRLHKMSLKQATKEMEAVGLRLQENISNLPWQHFMVFVKD
jgi:ubiquinone/menaquinone biosynthesis C-methylase UbiE